MIASNYKVVRYQPDLKDRVLELQTHLWSPSLILNREYFDWKFEQNPYQKKPLLYLAMHDGEAVGMRSFFEVRWQAGVPAQTFPCLYADDAVVAPNHRNCGLMPRIMTTAFSELANSSYDYVFNLSAAPITFLTSISMGWRSAGYVQPMYRRTWRAAFSDRLHRVLKRLPLMPYQMDLSVGRWLTRGGGTLGDIDEKEVRQISHSGISFQNIPRSTDMAELVERIGSSGRIRHVRDPAYFDWRFQNPLSRYRFLFRDNDRLEGYLVLHEFTSELAMRDMVNIVDWEASSLEVKAELLCAALQLVGNRRLVVWAATQSQETIELLAQKGFRLEASPPGVLQQCPGILARAIREQTENDWRLGDLRITDMANWDLRMLFSMRG